MEASWYIYIIIILLLTVCSGFSSASETAITSLNFVRIKSLAKVKNNKKKKRARMVFKLVKNYNSTLTTILIFNTVVNLVIGTLSTMLFVNGFQLGNIAPIIATLVSTLLVLIFGEILPKSIAKLYPEKIALNLAYPLYVLIILFYPLTMIFKLLQVKSKAPTSSEQELIELVSIIEREGVLEKGERDLIESAIKFDEKTVYQAMQPKQRIRYIYHDTPASVIKDIYLKEKYSRIPVLDSKTEEVIGILNIKDYIAEMLQNQKPDLSALISEPIFLSKRMKLNQALEILQAERTHIAIVCINKEKKDFNGIVTLEDILEELVGEIYDETDKIGLVQEVGTYKFLVDGRTNVDVLFKRYLKSTPPALKQSMTVEEWYRLRTKNKTKTLKKNSPLIKYRHFTFQVDKIKKLKKKGQIIIFKVEILTNKKLKNEWD
ncbi:MAG: hemolysin family protein [Spiroplasma sp.]|nr:hemolysin family protein [Spiroplasma sp.]